MDLIYELGLAAASARPLKSLIQSSIVCTSARSSSGAGSHVGVSMDWECSNAEYLVIMLLINAQSSAVMACKR